MAANSMSYHAGQRAIERGYFLPPKTIKQMLDRREAFLVPAKYGRKGVYIPSDNKIVIVNAQITKALTFTDPADYYVFLLKKAKEIIESPQRIIFCKNGKRGNKRIYYSEDGYQVHTTISGKRIIEIKEPRRG